MSLYGLFGTLITTQCTLSVNVWRDERLFAR